MKNYIRDKKTFGDMIFSLRERKGLTRTQLTELIEEKGGKPTSIIYIYYLELGWTLPSPKLLKLLSSILECDYWFLEEHLELAKFRDDFKRKYDIGETAKKNSLIKNFIKFLTKRR